MAVPPGGGVYVKSLFRLLALLQIPQRAVCQHLGLSPTFVSLMAKGRRPMPKKHLEAFEQLLSDAMDRQHQADLQAIWEELGPERAQTYLREVPKSDEAPLGVAPPGPDAPACVQRWWAYYMRRAALLAQWVMETRPDPYCREAQRLCGQLCQYHLMDADKFDALFLSPQRDELVRVAEELLQVARVVDRADIEHITQRLRSTLQPSRRSR